MSKQGQEARSAAQTYRRRPWWRRYTIQSYRLWKLATPSWVKRPLEFAVLDDEEDTATKQHYYRIKVWGYVFPQLPPGSPPEAIKAAVEKAVWEDGDLDITGTTVEVEFDD